MQVTAIEVVRTEIVAETHAIVSAHNHPSRVPEPSEADIRITRDLIRASQLLKIGVLEWCNLLAWSID